jgi:hypothetical protein
MKPHSEFRSWAQFVGEVVCDFLFLTLWLLMAWSVHEVLARHLPLGGIPRYVGYGIEGMLDVSTMLKLFNLRFKGNRL